MDASSSQKTKEHSGAINATTSRAVVTSPGQQREELRAWEDPEAARGGSSGSETCLAPSSHTDYSKGTGIMRTVETVVVVDAVLASDKERKVDHFDL